MSVIKADRKELESQILYYIIEDPSNISRVFKDSFVETSFFKEKGINQAVNICVDYYETYGKAITDKEYEVSLQRKFTSKKIEESEHLAATKAWAEAKDWDGVIDDSQFDRIYKDFVDVAINKKAIDIIVGNKDLLEENKTTEYIVKTTEELGKIIRINDDEDSNVEVLDVYRDVDSQIKDIEERRDPSFHRGIPTGIKAVDNVFVGFEPKNLTVIVAMVNTGKSTLTLNLSKNMAEMYGKKVLIISLEMSTQQWARKFNSLDFEIPYTYLQKGDTKLFSDSDFIKLTDSLKERKEKVEKNEIKGEYKILTASAGKYSFQDLMRIKDKKLPTFKPDVILIDQLSLIRIPGKKPKQDELGDVTNEIIAYGQANDIPMVLVAQANRASVQKVKGKREIDINIENIEDSHKVGANAHNVMALMVPPGHEAGGIVNRMLIKMVKQRDGPSGTIEIQSHLDYCAMTDIEEINFEDMEDLDLNDTGLDDIEANDNPIEIENEMSNQLVGLEDIPDIEEDFSINEENVDPEDDDDLLGKNGLDL